MTDTPERQLAAYLRETEPALPERYRKPGAGARPRAFRVPAAVPYGIGLVIVLAGMAWAMGRTIR